MIRHAYFLPNMDKLVSTRLYAFVLLWVLWISVTNWRNLSLIIKQFRFVDRVIAQCKVHNIPLVCRNKRAARLKVVSRLAPPAIKYPWKTSPKGLNTPQDAPAHPTDGLMGYHESPRGNFGKIQVVLSVCSITIWRGVAFVSRVIYELRIGSGDQTMWLHFSAIMFK